MLKTLVALYPNIASGQSAVEALIEAGFSGDDISLLTGNHSSASQREVRTSEGVSFGALVGVLVGIGSALMPGIGPVIGTGALGVAVTAGVGAAAGALTGGLTTVTFGFDKQVAGDYITSLRSDGVIVSITTNEQWLEWAERIVSRYQPLRLDLREAPRHESAWSLSGALAENIGSFGTRR